MRSFEFKSAAIASFSISDKLRIRAELSGSKAQLLLINSFIYENYQMDSFMIQAIFCLLCMANFFLKK